MLTVSVWGNYKVYSTPSPLVPHPQINPSKKITNLRLRRTVYVFVKLCTIINFLHAYCTIVDRRSKNLVNAIL